MNRLLWVGLIALTIFSACKKNKAAVTYIIPTAILKDTLLNKLGSVELKEQRFNQFQWLTAKIRITDERGGNLPVPITASLRMKRDSAIWMSFSPGLGIEAMRLLATQKEILLVDKINRVKRQMTYAQLSGIIGAPLNYAAFESLLLGNVPMPEDFVITKAEPEAFTLQYQFGNVLQTLLMGPASFRMYNYNAKSQNDSTLFQLKFNDFQENQGIQFAMNRIAELQLSLKDGGLLKSAYSLTYSKLQVVEGPLEMPFTMPENYSWGKE
jgi:hypothetical protein